MTPGARKGLILALALAAGASACSKDNQQAAQTSSDSIARNLTLAPGTATPAELNDVASPATTSPEAAPATPAPSPKTKPAARTPAKAAPAPHAATSYTAASGTTVELTANDTISSRTAAAGQAFSARVSADVKDAAGHVVIPAGSTVQGSVVEVTPGGASNPGTLKLAVNSVTVRGTSYPLEATIESAGTISEGRGVTGKDAAKVGAGAAAGAIAGRILGKNTRGTIIGGIVGAAAGAGVARATRTVDIVLPAGANVQISLAKPITVPAH
ncbi:MAG TPA: hypothetical protein VF832_11040 [Longimicrobiales bacterium]